MKESQIKAVGYSYAVLSDTGRSREENQDAWGHFQCADRHLFVLADGMGGARGGSTASALAVNLVTRLAVKDKERADIDSVCFAIEEASKLIAEQGAKDNELSGMGTTIVCLLADKRSAQYAHVGDSRLYLYREGELQRLSRDHTVVQDLMDSGALSASQAEIHPMSGMLTRALGQGDGLEIDVGFVEGGVLQGDKFLLCCDGLTDHVSDREIVEILQVENAESATEFLVNLANARGGRDNITVQVVEALPLEENLITEEPTFTFSLDAFNKKSDFAQNIKQIIKAAMPAIMEKTQEFEPSLIDRLRAEIEADQSKQPEAVEVESILPENYEEVVEGGLGASEDEDFDFDEDLKEEPEEIDFEDLAEPEEIDEEPVPPKPQKAVYNDIPELPTIESEHDRLVHPVLGGVFIAVLLTFIVVKIKPEYLGAERVSQVAVDTQSFEKMVNTYKPSMVELDARYAENLSDVEDIERKLSNGERLPRSLLYLIEQHRKKGVSTLEDYFTKLCTQGAKNTAQLKGCLKQNVVNTSRWLDRLEREVGRGGAYLGMNSGDNCKNRIALRQKELETIEAGIARLEDRIAREGSGAALKPELSYDEVFNPKLGARYEAELSRREGILSELKAIKAECDKN